MSEQPPQEQIPTPEKSAEELYLDAIEKKRDTLSAFHMMNSFRKSRSPEEMSPEELEQYKVLREDWRSKKEASFDSWDLLPEEKQQELTALGNRLEDVQVKLASLREDKKEEEQEEVERVEENLAVLMPEIPTIAQPEETPSIQSDREEDLTGEARIRPDQETETPEFIPDKPERELAFTLERQRAFSEMPKVGLGQDLKDAVKKGYESVSSGEAWEKAQAKYRWAKELVKDKTKNSWSWLKERGKGVASFGLWEFYQAEKLRKKTKETSVNVQALSTLIQGEMNLNPDEAEEEAWETMNALKYAGIETSSAPEFLEASKYITLRKAKENEEEIGYIVKTAREELREKLGIGKGAFKEYRKESGQKLSPEDEKRFEDALRLELNKVRIRQGAKDVAGFAKLMRQNLDERWKWRYVWGGAEMALWATGISWWMLSKEAAATVMTAGTEQATEQAFTQAMNENIWTTLKEMALNGPQNLNLDNTTLQELSQKVLDINKMYEPEWINNAIEGLKSSRILPQGMPIQIPPEVMKVLGF